MKDWVELEASGLEYGTPGLGIQRFNHHAKRLNLKPNTFNGLENSIYGF